MSQKMITAVFKHDLQTRTSHKLIALYLAFKASDDGSGIEVTTEEVATKARVSVRTARETLAKMVADDWLVVVQPGRGDAPTQYNINPGWVAAATQ